MPDTVTTDNADSEKRRSWLAALSRVSTTILEEALRGIDTPPDYAVLKPAETGLAMVRGRAGGTGQRFNLGEMTVSRCVVSGTGDAEGIIGVGYVKGRDRRHAELVALFDLMLQLPSHHGAVWSAVIEPTNLALRSARAQRAAEVAETKVEFFTLVRGED